MIFVGKSAWNNGYSLEKVYFCSAKLLKYAEKDNRRRFSPMERLKRYYFQKDSGLELVFLVRMYGECVSLEVKAKSSKAKSARTVLNHPEKYHVKQIIKFGDYNIGREGHLLTLPSYMQFLLNLQPEGIVLEPMDIDEINYMASEFLGK